MQPDVEVRVEILHSLSQPDLDAVSGLVAAATETDGVAPLGEATVLDMLSGRSGDSRHVVVLSGSADDGEQVFTFSAPSTFTRIDTAGRIFSTNGDSREIQFGLKFIF